MSINNRHRAHWKKCLLFWYDLKIRTIFFQIIIKGCRKTTYQEMLGLRHMKKEKKNHYEHCSSVSARFDLSWNTRFANSYKSQTWYLSILLHKRVSDEKKISCENALISASLAIKEANFNITHQISLEICTFFA